MACVLGCLCHVFGSGIFLRHSRRMGSILLVRQSKSRKKVVKVESKTVFFMNFYYFSVSFWFGWWAHWMDPLWSTTGSFCHSSTRTSPRSIHTWAKEKALPTKLSTKLPKLLQRSKARNPSKSNFMQWCIDMLALFPLWLLFSLICQKMKCNPQMIWPSFKCREKLSLDTSFRDS